MDFEDHQEDHEEEKTGLPPPIYDSLGNSTPRPNPMPSPAGVLNAPPSTAPARKPRYRECLKNHAVGIGGQAIDGCGEFMPAGPDGTLDALKCAACNCHRNFHRKESDTAAVYGGAGHLLTYHPHPNQLSPFYRSPTGYLHAPPSYHRPLALPSSSGGGGGGGGGGSHGREDQDDHSDPTNMSFGGVSKKRHRTKFTQEQKEKMMCLAEKMGWRIQKQDEGLIQQFCDETGVKLHVLKVWMHNNKHTLGKKP